MPDELIDIFDSENKPTGKRKMKTDAHMNGLWHRGSHIWLYNSSGEILLQLRSKDNFLFPNRWDISAAGHVGAGEEPISAAIRELNEELGVKVTEKELGESMILKMNMRFNKIKNNEFCYVYFLKYDKRVEDFSLQEEELQMVKFISAEELQQDLKKNPENYVDHGNYWQIVIEEVKKRTKK